MSRFIDVDKLIDVLERLDPNISTYYEEGWTCDRVFDVIDSQSVDEVIQCKKCTHWGKPMVFGQTDQIKCCELAHYMIGENGFCVYGEEKE